MPSETTDSDSLPAACPACGEAAPTEASFCPGCGAALGDPAYCAECGEPFDADDRFCSNCGASRSDEGSVAVRGEQSDDGSVAVGAERSGGASRSGSRSAASPDETRSAFRRRVQDHLDVGWEIERDDDDRVVLVDRGIGSVAAHVLLFPFTSGVGNLLYGWWHYSKLAERLRLVRGGETTARHPPSVEDAGRVEMVSAYLLTALLLVIGVWVAFLAATSSSPPVALVGLVFAGLGLGVAPPVRRRLDRRHGTTTFGRQKTVDHRIVRPPESVDEPCVVCGEPFDRGLVRRRRDETVVAGVPLRTHSMRHNHYCPGCARSELFGGDADASIDEFADEVRAIDRDTSGSERTEEATE